MSKSLYQYKFQPEHKPYIEALFRQILPTYGYKVANGSRLFTNGSGWFTAKRRVEYRICGDMLNICIWKVVAPIVPMLEMGAEDANSVWGAMLNTGMKSAIEKTINKISEQYPITAVTICNKVDDNFLSLIESVMGNQ